MNHHQPPLSAALDQQRALLVQTAGAIGIQPDQVFSHEYLQTVDFDFPDFPAEQAAKLDLTLLHSILHRFSVDVTCYFELKPHDLVRPNEDPVVLDVVRDGANPAEIQRFQQRILPCQDLIFAFTLDKRDLLDHHHLVADHNCFYLFLFKEAMIDYFGQPRGGSAARTSHGYLKHLEDDLWPEQRHEKVIVLTPSINLHLDGPYLGFVGGELLVNWNELTTDEAPDFKRLSALYKACRKLVKWDQSWLERLTPYHLELEPDNRQAPFGDEETRMFTALLQQHLTNLSVLFTANHTIKKRAEWVGIYWDSQNRVEVPSAPTADTLLSAQSLARANRLLEAVRWVYDSEWPRDRIYFYQSSVAQELRRTPMVVPAQAMLDEIETIHGAMDRRLAQFIREKEQAFSAEERALQSFAASTADAFSRQVSQMIKAVSDTMLAAIAALLGSFIAAGFGQNTFDVQIFTIGMVVYSLYVLLFPLLYNMGNQWIQYRTLEDSVDASYQRFANKLGDDRARDLAGNLIERSRRRFRRWFILTVAVYLSAIVAGLAAAFWVPQLVT